MVENGAKSGSKMTKCGAIRMDFTVKITVGHGGERGLVQILFNLFSRFPLFSRFSHCSLTVVLLFSHRILYCILTDLILYSRVMVDPYSGALLSTVL